MQKPYVLAFAVLGSLATAACEDKKTSTTTTTGGETAAKDAFDRQFIDMMVPHHEQGMMMANMAEARAEHAELKTMARKMIDEQQRDVGEMKAMRKQWFTSDATPPMDKMPMLPGMEGHPHLDVGTMHTQLEAAKPFDKAFLDMMIDHHEMAIHASQLDDQKGTHPELKQLARKMADQQRREVDEMRSLRTQWYGAK